MPRRSFATLGRLGTDDAGQGLAEYGLVMALVAGLHRVEALVNATLADPPKTLLIGTAAAVFVLWLVASPRNR